MMKELELPELLSERQQALEQLIARLLTRALLHYPEEEIDKETFLTMLSEQYKNHERLSQGHNCKWGRISNPAKFIKNLKNEPWEYEGVKKHYNHLYQKLSAEDLEHMIKLWYVKFELSEVKELVEQFFSEEEERREQAKVILKGMGVERLECFLWEEFDRVYKLPPIEFLEIYYQYYASTREEDPEGEKPFLAKVEYIQGQLFDCICYDLISVDGELDIARMGKMVDLVKDSSTIEVKISILRKLLYLYPFHRILTPHPAFPENPRYWIYSEVIETLGKIGGEEAEKVLLEIANGDFHHEETKEEASE